MKILFIICFLIVLNLVNSSYLPDSYFVENYEEWFWKNKNDNCRVLNDKKLIFSPSCFIKTRPNISYELGKYCIKVKFPKIIPGTNLTMQLTSTPRILDHLRSDIMKLSLIGNNPNQVHVTFKPAKNDWDSIGFEKNIIHNSLKSLKEENEFCFRWDFTQFFGRVILYYINGIQVYGHMVDIFIPRNSKLKGSLIFDNSTIIDNDDLNGNNVEINELKFEELDFLD